MANFKIPETEFRTFRNIVELDDANFSNLIQAIEEIGPTVNDLDFTAALYVVFQGIPEENLKAIVRTIGGLYRVMSITEKTPEEVAKDIRTAVEVAEPRGFPEDKTALLEQRIPKMLKVGGGMSLVAKTVNVMTDQDKVCCGVRILSDVRPIFSESAETIDAEVIIHSLNITYHQAGSHKDFYVAMSFADLQKLKEAIERAEKKNALLKANIQKSGIRYFEDKN